MACSLWPGLRCMYRIVVDKWTCPASSWITFGGAPRIARCEQNVCLRMWKLPVTFEAGEPLGALHPRSKDLRRQSAAVVLEQCPSPAEVPHRRERGCELLGHRHGATPAAFGRVGDSSPYLPLDAHEPVRPADVRLLEGHDLAGTKAGVAAQENGRPDPLVESFGRGDESCILPRTCRTTRCFARP